MKSTYEQMGGTYRREGDYALPTLVAPDAPVLGIWGQNRRRCLMEHRSPIHIGMLLGGTLNGHLTETDQSAEAMFSRLTAQLVETEQVIEKLREYVAQAQPDFGDSKSVLTMLYEAYSDCNRLDDDQIKAGFHEIYRLMNGMELRDMDRIIYPVCNPCRDHEHSGFTAGVQMGLGLFTELNS